MSRPTLQDILRLGAYQITALERVPAHAAVDTSVELAKQSGGARAAGFVNAVLRRLSQAGPEILPVPQQPADAAGGRVFPPAVAGPKMDKCLRPGTSRSPAPMEQFPSAAGRPACPPISD